MRTRRKPAALRPSDKQGWATRAEAANHFRVRERTIRKWNSNWEHQGEGTRLPYRRFSRGIVRIKWADVRHLEAGGTFV
jgi:transposase